MNILKSLLITVLSISLLILVTLLIWNNYIGRLSHNIDKPITSNTSLTPKAASTPISKAIDNRKVPNIKRTRDPITNKISTVFTLDDKIVWEPKFTYNTYEMYSSLIHESNLELNRNIGITPNYMNGSTSETVTVELYAYDFDNNKQLDIEKKLSDRLNNILDSNENSQYFTNLKLYSFQNRWFIVPKSMFAIVQRKSFPLYEIGIRQNEIYLVKEYSFVNGCGVTPVELKDNQDSIFGYTPGEVMFEVCKNYRTLKITNPYDTHPQFNADRDIIIITKEGEIKDL